MRLSYCRPERVAAARLGEREPDGADRRLDVQQIVGCAAPPAAAAAPAPLRSHGTARKMPPDSTNGNSEPTSSSRRATDSADDSS